jgi:hypothetical protein
VPASRTHARRRDALDCGVFCDLDGRAVWKHDLHAAVQRLESIALDEWHVLLGGDDFALAFEGGVAFDYGEVGGWGSGFLRARDAREDTPDAHTQKESASHHV